MDSPTASGKAEVASSQPENELPVSELSQPDEKQSASTVSEQKVESPEQPPEVLSQAQQISLLAKAEEKAKQPVVLNPVPQQQVQQPQENKPVSTAERNTNTGKDSTSVEAELKTGQDLIQEMGLMEPLPVTPQSVPEETSSQTAAYSATQNDRTETAHSPVNILQSVIPPPEATKKRFTVKKVEDPVLNTAPSSESKLENNEPEPSSFVNTSSSSDKNSEYELIPREPESECQQEQSDDAAVLHANLERDEQLCVTQQMAGDTSRSKQSCHADKSDIERSSSALHEGEQLEINFDVQASKASNCLQIIRTSSTCRPPTPTYAFRPVDNSSSEDQALPRNIVRFESQISGEELNPGKPKVEPVLSSDDELPVSVPTEKEGVSSVREFVQGRFIVSASSDRPDTPSSESSDQAKHPLQPVEITLQDVTTAAGMRSNSSLTPSSSMESLNSVGSQPGLQYVHAISSSPQTILPEGQSSSNVATGSNKDQVRKNSGPNDMLNDINRHSLAKQEGDQV